MGRLTTHVLDTAAGCPASGVRIDLFAREGDSRRLLCSVATNDDGRVDGPLLEGADMTAGRFELVFHAGDYLAGRGVVLPDPPFQKLIVDGFPGADFAPIVCDEGSLFRE